VSEAVRNKNPRRKRIKEEIKEQMKSVTPDNAPEKIGETFKEKLARVQAGTKFYTGLQRLWQSMRDHGMGWDKRLAALAAILYFILPMDFLPDWIAYLGWLDDAAVVSMALAYIGKDNTCPAVSPERLLDEAERIHDHVHGKKDEDDKGEVKEEEEVKELKRVASEPAYNRTLERMRRKLREDWS
jgi:uncharacterized membrane protein YkvA (DUF1232 family)